MKEFDLINKYFNILQSKRDDITLGIGDDAAILNPPQNTELVMSMDTLTEGVHFFQTISPYDLGHRALAVNLSDLAAMGAEPAWAMLALTLPVANEKWVSEFTRGFFDLAENYNVQLIGGDTTQGFLSVSVQVTGFVPKGQAIKRSGANVGDLIAVTGGLGGASLALQSNKNQVVTPQIEQGLALRNKASAMIDVSDGLATDLQHILDASHVGATLIIEQLPLSTYEVTPEMALSGGDDYVLCFTLPQHQTVPKGCHVVGFIEERLGLRINYSNGQPFPLTHLGYQHFE